MFDQLRSLVSCGYEFLSEAPVWLRLREATVKNIDPSEEFLKISKEVKSLKGELRTRLYETSNTIEKMEGVINESNWIIDREKMRGKYKDTDFN